MCIENFKLKVTFIERFDSINKVLTNLGLPRSRQYFERKAIFKTGCEELQKLIHKPNQQSTRIFKLGCVRDTSNVFTITCNNFNPLGKPCFLSDRRVECSHQSHCSYVRY